MALLCAMLIVIALVISLPGTWAMCLLGRKAGALDTAPIPGQVKFEQRPIPNTGGIAIFLAIFVPMFVGLIGAWAIPADTLGGFWPALPEHLPRIHRQTPLAAVLLACLIGLHLLGLADDRRPMRAGIKLAVMTALAMLITLKSDARLLMLLDGYVGGAWLSIVVTVLWIVIVTNAMNFLDNMDGLSAGVGAIASAGFLIAALLGAQWFVAACLALLLGALVGFLVFNFPPARVFMGDSGSLVVGFLLAFLTVRTTFYEEDSAAGAWYGVFMPMLVLAVPLYDFCSVTVIRLVQGRSPFVGDLQHFSHRLVQRGLSRRAAVLVIWGLTCVTAISGMVLGSLAPWQAVLVGGQTILILLVIAIFEWRSLPARRAVSGPEEPGDVL